MYSPPRSVHDPGARGIVGRDIRLPLEKQLIYLAIPYSHPDPLVRSARFVVANRVAARLMQEGNVVYSPISHSHPIAQFLPSGCDGWDFWAKQDLPMLRAADVVYVVTAPGYEHSVGVDRECRAARDLGVPVHFIGPGYGE